MLLVNSKKSNLLLVSHNNNLTNGGNMIQEEKYTPKYTATELEEFKTELEKKMKKQVFLQIEKYRYKHGYYKTHGHIYDMLCCKKINTEIKYSRKLYEKYNKERIEEIRRWYRAREEREEETEKKIEEAIREDIMSSIKNSNYHLIYDIVHFEPEEFDEEVAYKCGLQPFIYVNHDVVNRRDNTKQRLKLLAVVGDEHECEARLDVYQAITSGMIRKYNILEDKEYSKEYLKRILGKEIMEEMEKKLIRNYTVKFYFENCNDK